MTTQEQAGAGGTVEEKVEWSVHLVGELGVFGGEHTFSAQTEHNARATLTRWRATRPDVRSELVSRDVEIRRGAWTPVADA